MASELHDEVHMRHALRLAARALGCVAPNPAVGCVIVSKDGVLVGRGWTAPGGRPHAEVIALEQAGTRANGSTVYVTLEPCAHHGATPPCADALVEAGVARVVAAIEDPDSRVNGAGFKRLEAAGITVTRGLCEEEAHALNAGFFFRVGQDRPLVALKSAESADGFIAPLEPGARWITSEDARRHGHLLRAKYDAILVGIETALADDPMLDCRLEGMEDRSPVRIVLDSRLRLPLASRLARTAREHPVILFTVSTESGDALKALGVEIVRLEAGDQGRPEIEKILATLAERGITRLLVEGGPEVQKSFIARGLADLIYRYRASHNLGAGRPSALTEALADSGGQGSNVEELERLTFGPDQLEVFRIKV